MIAAADASPIAITTHDYAHVMHVHLCQRWHVRTGSEQAAVHDDQKKKSCPGTTKGGGPSGWCYVLIAAHIIAAWCHADVQVPIESDGR
jgi:hypothetical protein